MFLIDMSQPALFARKPPKEEKKPTLRQRIVGTTNAGKAFRVGALASGLGLGYLALKNKGKLAELKKSPKDFYTRDVGEDVTAMRRMRKNIPNPEYDASKPFRNNKGVLTSDKFAKGAKAVPQYIDVPDMDWHDGRRTAKKGRSFVGTGRAVKWGRVGKTLGIGGAALAVPTTLAYAAGSKKDKEDISRRTTNTYRTGKSALNDARTWVNTLHRVSR